MANNPASTLIKSENEIEIKYENPDDHQMSYVWTAQVSTRRKRIVSTRRKKRYDQHLMVRRSQKKHSMKRRSQSRK